MDATEELDDGTRIARRGTLWYMFDGSGPVGRGYHAIEPAPVDDFYFATRGSRTFVVDARGTPVSAGYHSIEYLGDGEFRGTEGASQETFGLPADARADEAEPETESGDDAPGASGASAGDETRSDGGE